MTRRLITLIATAAMMFSLVPGLPAAALSANTAVTGIARVTTGNNVFPGLGRDYVIEVRPDSQINYVNIILPNTAGLTTTSSLTPPSGWKGEVTTFGTTQQITFTGAAVSGSVLNFGFLADVARPLDRDKGGKFRVELSNDGGVTSTRADEASARPGTPNGTLDTIVRILHVFETILGSPNGIIDGTGTTGQTIQILTKVRNYAIAEVTAQSWITSASGLFIPNDDKTNQSNPETGPVPGGGTATFSNPVTLGATRDASGGMVNTRAVTYTGRATSTGSTAVTSSVDFTIQRPAVLALPNVSNVAPTRLAPQRTYTVEVPMRKSRLPGVTVTGGTLSFGATSCPLEGPVAFAKDGTSDATLSFICTTPTQEQGREESFPADLVLSGTDSNDALFSHEARPQRDQSFPLARTLTFIIDSIIPIIDVQAVLPRDEDLRQQDAAKPGDTITVEGRIQRFEHKIESVVIRPDVGPDIPVQVERIPDPENLDGDYFRGSVTANFDKAATTFRVIATATSAVDTKGQGFSRTIDVLTSPPPLETGFTISTTDLEGVFFDGEDFEPTAIRAEFGGAEAVRGGCNPLAWEVDGAQVVVAVLYSNGQLCEPGSEGTTEDDEDQTIVWDNHRILLLGVPIDRNATPSATYTPIPGDRAKDRAGNFTPLTTIDTQSLIGPPLVQVLDVYRNTGSADTNSLNPCDPGNGVCENAYRDAQYEEGGAAYFTRFSGSDLIVRVGRAAPNYRLEVSVDGVPSATTTLNSSTGWIRVPLGSLEKEYKVELVYRNLGNALTSKSPTAIKVVLDQTAPELASDGITELASPDPRQTRWRVEYTEKVVAGLDASQNWKIYEDVFGELESYSPNNVDREKQAGDPQMRDRLDTRVLTFTEWGAGELEGAGYLFNPVVTNNRRYEDRAGNLLANTDGPAAFVNPKGLL